ncbi:MAG: (deoxy)nucleoside triphosphate pyrophosphohydrolase [Candidatus Coproplasma sp.]
MKPSAQVVAAFIRDRDRFLICRRPPHKARGLLWEFVGGKVEPGESPEQALVRECREELEITVEPLGRYAEVRHEYPDIDIDLILFECVITDGEPRLSEHVDMRWITPSEIRDFEFCPADEEILAKIRAERP